MPVSKAVLQFSPTPLRPAREPMFCDASRVRCPAFGPRPTRLVRQSHFADLGGKIGTRSDLRKIYVGVSA